MRNLMIAILLAAGLAGCAGMRTSEPPAWINGNDPAYPESRFLIGRGEGSSAALARDRARADLVKVFETRIVEQSEDSSSATRRRDGEQVTEQAESAVRRTLFTASDHDVEGIRIADAWFEPQGRVHHALAALDRNAAATRLRERIESLDARTQGDIASTRKLDDPLRRLGTARDALQAQQERTTYQRYLRIIDPTGIGVPARYELAKLVRDHADLAARLRIAPSAETALKPVLASALADAGFQPVEESDADATYTLRGELALDSFSAEGWEWARGMLRVSLLEPGGALRVSGQWPIKASAQQAPLARQRALLEAERVLKKELPVLLTGNGEH